MERKLYEPTEKQIENRRHEMNEKYLVSPNLTGQGWVEMTQDELDEFIQEMRRDNPNFLADVEWTRAGATVPSGISLAREMVIKKIEN